MTDEILAKAEAAAKAAALAQLNKQESWARANRKALIIGAVIALVLGFIAGKVF